MQSITFFETSVHAFGWFQKNHDRASEIWIGFYSVKSAKKCATYKEVLDEALCFGWIDGIRENAGADSYVIGFTPRKGNSIWSTVNTRRINELIKQGRVLQPGLEVLLERNQNKAGIYSFEQDRHELSSSYQKKFKANQKHGGFLLRKLPGTSEPPFIG